jgi:hypothetical protein
MGRGGGTPGDWGVARGEGLGGVGTGHWRGGARTVRGGGWRRVGIRGVAGGGAPGDQGVACGEGLGGVGTEDWCDGAQTARGGAWRHMGIRGEAGGDARGSEGWRHTRLVWSVWGLAGGRAQEEEH